MGNKQFSGFSSMLSNASKSLSTNFLADPHKMENILGMVRTAAPLTSAQTVSKVNTYLPAFEKVSTLMGLYSFLAKAQNYSPIEPLNAKTPMEKVAALMKNGNIPVAKLMAQPLLANNMEKIMGNMVKDMMKNGDIGDLLSSMTKQMGNDSKNNSSKNNDGNLDIASLFDTFMPILNSMASSNESSDDEDDDIDDVEEIKAKTIKNENKKDIPVPIKKVKSSSSNLNKNFFSEDEIEEEIPINIENNVEEDTVDNYENEYPQYIPESSETPNFTEPEYNDKNQYPKNNYNRPLYIRPRRRKHQ